MVKLTEAEARKLGIGRNPKEVGGERKKTGRTRTARRDYPVEAVEFEIPLLEDPKPKKRARTVTDLGGLKSAFLASKGRVDVFMQMATKGLSRSYTPKETAEYERLVSAAAGLAMAGRAPMECPVDVALEFTLVGDPGTWPTSTRDGDADNLEKAVMDAMNGVVFADDRLVVRAAKEKKCGMVPSVRVRVVPAAP